MDIPAEIAGLVLLVPNDGPSFSWRSCFVYQSTPCHSLIMVKPTLLQNLFNRPTQSYNFPNQKKQYHSHKNELVRIAQSLTDDLASSPSAGLSSSSGRDHNTGQIPVSISWSPLISSGSDFAFGQHQPKVQSTPKHEKFDVVQNSNRIDKRISPADSASSDSDSDEEVFFTPTSSPRSSGIQQSPHTSASLVPFLTPPPTCVPLREHSVDSMTSTTATTSAADVGERDAISNVGSAENDSSYSVFSYAPSNSTRITTPVTSDYSGHFSKRPASALTRKRSGSRSKRSSTSSVRTSATDDNWAKDVRWLIPPQSTTSLSLSKSSVASYSAASVSSSSSAVPAGRKTLRHKRSKSLNYTSSSRSNTSSHPLKEQPIPPPSTSLYQQAAPPRRAKSVHVRRNQNAMSAVIEVDEPTENNTNTELHQALMGRDRTRTNSLTPSKSQLRPQSSRSRVSNSPNLPLNELPQTQMQYPPVPRSQYTTSSRTVDLPIPTTTVASNLPSSGTAGFTSLVLPRASHASPQKSTKAKLKLGFGALGGGEVDLTKGGMAQTTMASIEVVHGIAGSSTLATNSAVRKTLPRSFHFFKSSNSKGKGKGKGKGKAVDIDESPLTFTSWRKPPGYVGAQGVLVQVWAVGVDGVDRLLVTGANTPAVSSNKSTTSLSSQKSKKDGEWTKKADVGFIPGRSFVGRVVECGWDINEELMKKNDWVVGLLDIKKVCFTFPVSCERSFSPHLSPCSVVLWRNSSYAIVDDSIASHILTCRPTAPTPIQSTDFTLSPSKNSL